MQRNYHSATASTRNFPLVTSGHRFPRFPRFPGFPCLVHLIGDWEFHLPRPSPSSQILRSDHGSTSHKLDLFLFIIYIYTYLYMFCFCELASPWSFSLGSWKQHVTATLNNHVMRDLGFTSFVRFLVHWRTKSNEAFSEFSLRIFTDLYGISFNDFLCRLCLPGSNCWNGVECLLCDPQRLNTF